MVVCDGTASIFYINGTEVGRGAPPKTDIYTIGNQPLGNQTWGAIAGLQIYDHAVPLSLLPAAGTGVPAGGR